jgi:PAS domain-containing protein
MASAVPAIPEAVLETALAAWADRRADFPGCLDDLPAPLYLTDPEGVLTYYNKACVDFAGRVPQPHRDRWCVTWKLWTETGEPLPHDRCPMAVAVRERRPVRGVSAVAERPDGVKVDFLPYPTPLFDASGTFVGAVNLLHDISRRRRRERLRAEAARCRRLAGSVGDAATVERLEALAREYEAEAGALADEPAGNA